MSTEIKAQLLDTIREESLGVREMARRFRKRPETIISLIREMENEGLLETSSQLIQKKGRPKRILKPTALGEEYAKAKRDAEYVNRLIARGKNPYQAFAELNDLVRAS